VSSADYSAPGPCRCSTTVMALKQGRNLKSKPCVPGRRARPACLVPNSSGWLTDKKYAKKLGDRPEGPRGVGGELRTRVCDQNGTSAAINVPSQPGGFRRRSLKFAVEPRRVARPGWPSRGSGPAPVVRCEKSVGDARAPMEQFATPWPRPGGRRYAVCYPAAEEMNGGASRQP